MYALIKAKENHIDQLVPLFASTGYWDFGLKHNQLNISHRAFMKEVIVKPYLPFTTIIVSKDKPEIVLGTVVSATTEALSKMPNREFDALLNPLTVDLFKNVFNFKLTQSYHISFLAVAKSFRGQGLGRILLEYAETQGKLAGCETLSLYTASCQTSAIKLYHRFGMMITKTINVSNLIPFPFFLYFEKNERLMLQHDYFETDEYQQLDMMDLA